LPSLFDCPIKLPVRLTLGDVRASENRHSRVPRTNRPDEHFKCRALGLTVHGFPFWDKLASIWMSTGEP
jgi:hypothetical protein